MIADYLQRSGRAAKNKVHAGTAPRYGKGAAIAGVYALAGQPDLSCGASARSPLAEVLTDLARTFAQIGARWYLFGAQAAILYGAARLSADVDVTVALGDRGVTELVEPITLGAQHGGHVLQVLGAPRQHLRPASPAPLTCGPVTANGRRLALDRSRCEDPPP